MEECCEHCKFFQSVDTYKEVTENLPSGGGMCRVSPPMLLHGFGRSGVFPIVHPDDWCGEFEPSKR